MIARLNVSGLEEWQCECGSWHPVLRSALRMAVLVQRDLWRDGESLVTREDVLDVFLTHDCCGCCSIS